MNKKLLTLPLVLLASACSTITTGTTQDLTVETPEVLGATCTLTDSKQATWTIQSTPGTSIVTKGDGPMKVTCSKDGYQTNSVMVEEGLAGMTFGNVLLGGGVGIIVDAASGAAQEYPDVVYVWLQPEKWKSAEDEAKWHEAKAAFELAEEEKKQKQNPDDENR